MHKLNSFQSCFTFVKMQQLKLKTLRQSPEWVICNYAKIFFNRGWTDDSVAGLAIKQDGRISYIPSELCVQSCDKYDVKSMASSVDRIDLCAGVVPFLFENANAVGHFHSINARLAAAAGGSVELPNTRKNLFGARDNLVLPILEGDDDTSLDLAIRALDPDAIPVSAVLIKDHGLLVWGDNWQTVVKKLEAIEALLEAKVRAVNQN